MKITFLGATHEVTGSCYYLEVADKHLIVDCGMQQGKDEFENQTIPVNPSLLDFIFVTHAHIDHTGLIPLLQKNGFKGKIISTDATYELCKIMLRDSAHIQKMEAEWQSRKAERAGRGIVEPLYTEEDVFAVLEKFETYEYDKKIRICDNIEIRFVDAGHLLGSSSIEMWLNIGETVKKIVFSGDIGNVNQPILRNPQFVKEADYLVIESTYAGRNHEERPNYIESLSNIIEETFKRGGNLVIPSFAVGRTQELLYFIRKIKNDRLIKTNPNFKVYVDSPLAVEATNVFKECYLGYYDEEAMELIKSGVNPISFDGLILTTTSDESKMINFDKEPKIIISSSGMCEAGRIRHHLKHNLWRSESTVLFVGYQGANTLGKALLNGEKSVKIFGEEINVMAKIETLQGISGHADDKRIKEWIGKIENKPQHIFVIHGEDEAVELMEKDLNEIGYNATAPYSGTVFDLLNNKFLYAPDGVRIVKKENQNIPTNFAYEKLLRAGERLISFIPNFKKRSNKDISKLESLINSICDKLKK